MSVGNLGNKRFSLCINRIFVFLYKRIQIIQYLCTIGT